ncbi:hypothetical protein N7493_008554 [Penicillium malachiteum]|uniref:Protein kinase domain-containing protein n=1 Tax=Penicillium malachiteum TaxID=1324776 RepID=A0AAD6HHQ9_9EURO|nr:hypothetical protein N7493_008554 [Penicillium malachiteum]
MVGKTLQDGRYNIVDKLGHGGYSTVWLTYDNLLKRYMALKVNIASSVPRETQVLRALYAPSCDTPGRRFIPELLNEFKVQGLNGIHTCYTVSLAACSLRGLPFSILPLSVARVICYSLTQAIAYIHSQGYVHGDIHLDNVLLTPISNFNNLSVDQFYQKYGNPQAIPVTQRNDSNNPLPPNIPARVARPLLLRRYIDQVEISKTQILLNDFGEAFNPALEVRLGKDCHTPQGSRAPEAKFEADSPLTARSDIWSLATALWEIMGMKPIFSHEYVHEDEVVAQNIDVLGPIAFRLPTASYSPNKWPPLDGWFEEAVQEWRRKQGSEIEEEEKVALLNFMRQMLVYRSERRPTADEVLRSE